MRYITGEYALNIPCSLPTTGDWHYHALNWQRVRSQDTRTAFFGSYGIERHSGLPGFDHEVLAANHIRACLDLLADNLFPLAQGMRNDFIGNDELNEEIFSQVWKLHNQINWRDIDRFMESEYKLAWLDHKKDRHDDSISYNTSEEILDDIAEQDLLELLSLNDKMADHSKTGCREDIKVSNVDSLTVKKAFAYDSRDRIRDLIDLTFIVNNCLDLMRPETQDVLIEVLSRKGLEQLDYLLRTQGDLVSDKLTLKANFLSMFEKLELL